MCECQPEIGHACTYHAKRRAEERRARAAALRQIKCPQCREIALALQLVTEIRAADCYALGGAAS